MDTATLIEWISGGSVVGTVTTEAVAGWFRSRTDGALGWEIPADLGGKGSTWASGAGDSYAVRTLGGNFSADDVETTVDPNWEGNTIRWVDLAEFCEGEMVWRVTCHETLYAFRRQAEGWSVLRLENFNPYAAVRAVNPPDAEEWVSDLIFDLTEAGGHPFAKLTAAVVAALAVR